VTQEAATVRRADADDPGQRPARVFVVDDHAVVRRGLRAYLEVVEDLEVVGEAADAEAALEAVAALAAAGRPPGVVLMTCCCRAWTASPPPRPSPSFTPRCKWWR
jgi:PleD family two-component response regulator